jgi:hypothetical protein
MKYESPDNSCLLIYREASKTAIYLHGLNIRQVGIRMTQVILREGHDLKKLLFITLNIIQFDHTTELAEM